MKASFPLWLHALAMTSVTLGIICACFIALDEMRFPQRMAVMNLVWPLTALFGSLIWLGGYLAWGRAPASRHAQLPDLPFAIIVAKGSSHWFRPAFGAVAPVDSFEFWFAMQLAMFAGFVTAYPVNWILISIGWKERM